mmetsp:Transcript_13201/g.18690  ORF Transcript_13201/g.18690 Transcript_13201/m.18690 type:complete len:225 (-) Transcript_13201:983-1657(-)
MIDVSKREKVVGSLMLLIRIRNPHPAVVGIAGVVLNLLRLLILAVEEMTIGGKNEKVQRRVIVVVVVLLRHHHIRTVVMNEMVVDALLHLGTDQEKAVIKTLQMTNGSEIGGNLGHSPQIATATRIVSVVEDSVLKKLDVQVSRHCQNKTERGGKVFHLIADMCCSSLQSNIILNLVLNSYFKTSSRATKNKLIYLTQSLILSFIYHKNDYFISWHHRWFLGPI